MDLKKIKKLIELLQSSQLSGLEIHEGDTSIKLSREIKNSLSSVNYQHHNIPVQVEHSSITHAEALTAAPSVKDDHVHYVRSPMVGTFYRSSAPDKPPMVSIGDNIKKGDTLCIIEAMKILNFIQSDKSGVVKNILVNNGEAVEFEQPLFVIE